MLLFVLASFRILGFVLKTRIYPEIFLLTSYSAKKITHSRQPRAAKSLLSGVLD